MEPPPNTQESRIRASCSNYSTLPEVHNMFKPCHLDGNIGYAIGFHTNPLRQRHTKPTSNSRKGCTSHILAHCLHAEMKPSHVHGINTLLEQSWNHCHSRNQACQSPVAGSILQQWLDKLRPSWPSTCWVLILSNVIHTRKRSVKQAFCLNDRYKL